METNYSCFIRTQDWKQCPGLLHQDCSPQLPVFTFPEVFVESSHSPQPSFCQSKQAGVLCSLLVRQLCIFLITLVALSWCLFQIELIFLNYVDLKCTHCCRYGLIPALYNSDNASSSTGNIWCLTSLDPGCNFHSGMALMIDNPPKLDKQTSICLLHLCFHRGTSSKSHLPLG